MKIRTLTDLTQFLDSEFAWRRKELSQISSEVSTASDTLRPLRLRSGITILYAHWEGFIRDVADTYVSYVSMRHLNLNKLNYNFLAISLRRKLSDFQYSCDIENQISFVKYFLNNMEDLSSIPTTGTINTKANLSSKVLKQIIITLGLNYKPYELKENIIDAKLLPFRNNVAHGRHLSIDENEFNALYSEICGLLRVFKDQIEYAATAKSYQLAQ